MDKASKSNQLLKKSAQNLQELGEAETRVAKR